MCHHCLSINEFMDIWVVSTFCLLWILLLWTLVHMLMQTYVFNSLACVPCCRIIGMVILHLTFWEKAKLFPKWLHQFIFPSARYEYSDFSTPLKVKVKSLSHVRLFATPWTVAHQAPPSLGFSRQEHWSGLPFPSPMHESEKWKWSHSVVSDSSRPHGLQPTRLLRPWDFPGKSTGVGCHCLLQEIFPTQGLNLGLPRCRQTLYHLSHRGSLHTFANPHYRHPSGSEAASHYGFDLPFPNN